MIDLWTTLHSVLTLEANGARLTMAERRRDYSERTFAAGGAIVISLPFVTGPVSSGNLYHSLSTAASPHLPSYRLHHCYPPHNGSDFSETRP